MRVSHTDTTEQDAAIKAAEAFKGLSCAVLIDGINPYEIVENLLDIISCLDKKLDTKADHISDLERECADVRDAMHEKSAIIVDLERTISDLEMQVGNAQGS